MHVQRLEPKNDVSRCFNTKNRVPEKGPFIFIELEPLNSERKATFSVEGTEMRQVKAFVSN